MNRVILGGLLGPDLSTGVTTAGEAYACFSLCAPDTNTSVPDWVECVAKGELAESIANSYDTENVVRIEGALEQVEYLDGDIPRKIQRVAVERFERSSDDPEAGDPMDAVAQRGVLDLSRFLG